MSSQEAYMMYAAELDKLASLVDLADEEIQEKFAYDALGGYVAARSFDETMAKLAAMSKLKGVWNSAKGLFSRKKQNPNSQALVAQPVRKPGATVPTTGGQPQLRTIPPAGISARAAGLGGLAVGGLGGLAVGGGDGS